MADVEFGPERILGVLAAHGVRSILIGGFAAVIHGSPYVTIDVDVASLADVIRSKEAAGREKDRLVLPVLRRIAEAAEG